MFRIPVGSRLGAGGLALALLFACQSAVDAQPSGGPSTAKRPASKPKPGSARTDTSSAAEEALSPWEAGPSAPFRSTEGLTGIKKRGLLRVLVHGGGERFLPRAGMPAELDREIALDLAERLRVKVQFILVDEFGELLPSLLAGAGDLVAAQLTVTAPRKAQVAFTRPVLAVEEVLVGRKGTADLPAKIEDLAGREVHVRASSSYAETLAGLAAEKEITAKLVPVEETLDAEAIVYDVTQGRRPLTVVDSHILRAIETYNPDAQALFPIATGREIAWAVRKENRDLLAAANAVLIERAMTGHTHERFTGDLDGIKKRGALRVLTRNNPISYFLYRGRQYGFDYELARMLADDIGVRLEMVVPPEHGDLIPWLLDGRGDLIAASLSITPERAKTIAFSTRYLEVEQQIVQKKGAPAWKSLAELAGRTIHVRRSSSYFSALEAVRARVGDFTIVEVPETMDTEALLDEVGQGSIPLTVADSHFLAMSQTYGTPVEAAFALPPAGGKAGDVTQIAYAVRPGAKQLRAHVDRFVKKTYRGVAYNMARKRYFENSRQVRVANDARSAVSGQISPYDAIFKKYSKQYGLDWRLMAAQAYAESRFDPKAKSWVGARGLFQVMPRTGQAMGFIDLEDPEQGVHAGIQYMDKLMKRFDPAIPFRQRVRFALAAYNAGLGHVIDAQRLAAEKGWDPKRWFGNVEKAMLLLQQPEYAKRARHGYCRGGEPVKYVSHIQSYYDTYVKIVGP